jgi:hypothetical protein
MILRSISSLPVPAPYGGQLVATRELVVEHGALVDREQAPLARTHFLADHRRTVASDTGHAREHVRRQEPDRRRLDAQHLRDLLIERRDHALLEIGDVEGETRLGRARRRESRAY